MENLKPIAKPPPALVKWVVIVLLALGILFRFSHLGQKVYWHDEVFTSMEATAHTASELRATFFTGQETAPSALLAFQRIDPPRTLAQLVFGLGSEDPQHPPLFYLLLHFWMRGWGDSILVTRSFAALLSLLVFPAMYWLCQELFASALVGWVAIALLALSPIHLVYAQEAREYSLLTALTLFSSAALLRAVRLQQWQSWALYGVTLILSFYTAVFSALVALGHGLYVLGSNPIHVQKIKDGFQLQWQLTRTVIDFLFTGAIAVLAFTPWIYFLRTYSEVFKASTAWINVSLPLPMVFQMWMLNLTRVFFDRDIDLFSPDAQLTWVVIIPIVLLEIYAFYFLTTKAPRSAWWFVVALLIGTSLPLLGPDLLFGGQRSTVTRYFLPFFLCLQVAVAYLISECLTAVRSKQVVGIALSIALAIAGLTSYGTYAQANTWWNKVMSYHHPQIAQVLNASDRPLLMTDAFGYNPANVVSLSYLLNDTVKLLLLKEVGLAKEIPTLSNAAQPIFLLNLPDYFRSGFVAKYGGQFQPVVGELWRWKRP